MADRIVVRFHRLDDATLRATFTNPDGTAYDLTGATCKLVVKALATDTDAAALFTKTITATPNADGTIVAPATGGLADFYILPSNTAALGLYTDAPPVSYVLGVKIKTAAGKYYTPIDASLRLDQQLVESF